MPQHCDPDVFITSAVDGTELSPDVIAHVAACSLCRAEWESYRDTVAVGRTLSGVQLTDPPPATWQAIARGCAIPAQTGPDTADGGSRGGGGGATVTSLSDHRAGKSPGWTRWLPVGVAAGIGALLGGLVVGVAGSPSAPTSPVAQPQVVAQASLGPLPDGIDTIGSGTAQFEKDDNGNDLLVLDTENLEQAAGYYQVWLINPDTSGLVSLGTVGSGAQQVTFPVPAGIDPAEFSVVDISDEPLDGDPNHSKVSILRGELQT